MKKWLGSLSALGAALALSACASAISSAPPKAIYELSVASSFDGLPGGTRSQILITPPKSVDVINTDRVVIKPTATSINYFPDIRWADKAPRLVQLHISRAFSNTGGARAVGLPGDGLIIDHQLLFDLRAFQVEAQPNGFAARIELEVRIMNDRNGRILTTKIFNASVPTTDDPDTAVIALNAAMNEISKEVVSWVFSRI